MYNNQIFLACPTKTLPKSNENLSKFAVRHISEAHVEQSNQGFKILY